MSIFLYKFLAVHIVSFKIYNSFILPALTVEVPKLYFPQYGLELWCLTPLSTAFQLYRGGRFYWWRTPENPEKTTDLSQVTDKFNHTVLYRVHLALAVFEFTTLVALGTDCIGSYKSDYYRSRPRRPLPIMLCLYFLYFRGL